MTPEELGSVRRVFATLPGMGDGRPGGWTNSHVTVSVAGDEGLGLPWTDLAGVEVQSPTRHVFVLSAANPDTLEFEGVKCGPNGIVPAKASTRQYRIVKLDKGAGPDCVVALDRMGKVVEGPFSVISVRAEEYHPGRV